MPIEVKADPPVNSELERQVDEDIAKFDDYQQRVLRNPSGEVQTTQLTQYERSIIKTYLAYKLGLGPDDKTT